MVRLQLLSIELGIVTLVYGNIFEFLRSQTDYRHLRLELRTIAIPYSVKQEVTVNNQPNRVSDFHNGDSETGNLLWQYLKSLSPETVNQLSKPTSPEVFQVMERNITGLLGNLPPEQFGITISTSRENLGRLLASAMMSGYFLRNAEQRMHFEQTLQATASSSQGINEDMI